MRVCFVLPMATYLMKLHFAATYALSSRLMFFCEDHFCYDPLAQDSGMS